MRTLETRRAPQIGRLVVVGVFAAMVAAMPSAAYAVGIGGGAGLGGGNGGNSGAGNPGRGGTSGGGNGANQSGGGNSGGGGTPRDSGSWESSNPTTSNNSPCTENCSSKDSSSNPGSPEAASAASFSVSKNVSPVDGQVVITSQQASDFLVYLPVTATKVGADPPCVEIFGGPAAPNLSGDTCITQYVADPNYQFVFKLRWNQAGTSWAWGDGTTTAEPGPSAIHTYAKVNRGLTVVVTSSYTVQCAASVIDLTSGQSMLPPGSSAFGGYACTGATPGQLFPQRFTELSPPAPHRVLQVEALGHQ